jgi:hypothetical protein
MGKKENMKKKNERFGVWRTKTIATELERERERD